jgi:UDP-N-acetylmuramoyl-L-alanyl-D-glutamate--2,6-diaminopimelate ligase
LLRGIPYEGVPPQGAVTLVAQDSRKVVPGAVFVCIEGQSSDGHAYAKQALEDGAGMVVTQRPLGLAGEIQVEDSRAALSLFCQNFFGRPADKLTLVGVTGTDGKTTVSSIIKQVLQSAGIKCGLIGTIRTEIGEMHIPAKFTTPEPWDLNALFARMVAAGCTHVVMEASSQALAQRRLYGLRFALGVFTNLTRDHLDYHGTMEIYYEAKKLLFDQCDAVLINGDEEAGQRLLSEISVPKAATYAVKEKADYLAKNVHLQVAGVKFDLKAQGRQCSIHFPMPGEYSVYNALAAGGAAMMLDVPMQQAADGLTESRGVPGRCEVLHNGDFTVICDFAHTDAAVEKLLGTLRPFVKGRLLVLYGCTGDRDPAKRAPMSRAAVQYGDIAFLTSDNPRTEDPEKIMEDALPPLVEGGRTYYVELDRAKAVQLALSMLQKGDVLALCTKGHEDYQVLNGVTLYLREKQIVLEWAAANRLAPKS